MDLHVIFERMAACKTFQTIETLVDRFRHRAPSGDDFVASTDFLRVSQQTAAVIERLVAAFAAVRRTSVDVRV